MLSLTYHVEDIYNEYHFVRHELSLHKFKKNLIVINYLFDISQKEQIEYFMGGEKAKHVKQR